MIQCIVNYQAFVGIRSNISHQEPQRIMQILMQLMTEDYIIRIPIANDGEPFLFNHMDI